MFDSAACTVYIKKQIICQPLAMKYNGTLYYYVLNAQGDVVRIVDGSRSVVASYTYDPWGKIISSSGTLADINPLRYRGYYYDTETGFFYLQSRYYDPEIGRFINADSYASTDATGILSTNMFAYCENDPVNRSDPSGELFGTISGLIVGGLTGALSAYINGDDILAGTITGAVATIRGVGISLVGIGTSKTHNDIKSKKNKKISDDQMRRWERMTEYYRHQVIK